ncbi:AAA family ATPase [Actibacterium sp. 188UL27-1]|uniref:ATP-binding protein n=1 Tax=Actibacterium sp. 188UL27-1 TaxID=2786961 RepID=UPI001959A949|nr:adenylate/guanylate cyclase domain-containing protein [Actibacterium sp. 188UL27-1]MBM7068947.1 AAA family ATPase [Actibacterium sp. 188UL27-1]
MNKLAEGTRRWTAVFFTDMANFSAVTEALGSERTYQLVSRVIEIAVSVVEQHGGKPLTFAGDSLLASFGAPEALEDAALQACRASLEFQRQLVAECDRLDQQFGVRPEFRVGISGGMVVMGRMGLEGKMDLNIMGAPVNEASRLEALAEPGQILISEAVAAQAEGWLDLTDLGERKLKGFAQPTRIYQLIGLHQTRARFDATARRGLVPMVGREAEMARLSQIFAHVTAPTIAAISGPPGIGKSRLLHDFQNQSAARILLGQCNPATAKIPYKPFAELICAAAGTTSEEDGVATLAALSQAIPSGVPVTDLSLLFSREGDSPAAGEDLVRLRNAIVATMAALFQQQETIVVIEDAHWLDSASANLLGSLFSSGPQQMDTPWALILTHRPEFAPVWMGHGAVQRLPLEPLTRDQTKVLATRHLSDRDLSVELNDFLYEKAEGVPLFAEEILRFLTARDLLKDRPDGLTLETADMPDLVMGNVAQLILRRVDAMSQEVRTTLSYAAAIGRQFATALLGRLVTEEDVAQVLSSGVEAGLIEQDPTAGSEDWRFVHALLRDAIYDALLEGQRQQIHAQIGAAMVEWQTTQNTDLSAALAYHFTRADDPARAVKYLVASAMRNARVYALDQVNADLSRALDFIRRDPAIIDDDTHNQMCIIWVTALNDMGDFRGLINVGEELLPRIKSSGAVAEADRVIAMLGMALAHVRDYTRARQILEEAIARCDARSDTSGGGWCRAALIRVLEETDWEEPDTIQELAQTTIQYARYNLDHRLEMMARYLLSAHFRSMGDVSRARLAGQELMRFADANDDMRARSYACWSEAIVLQTSDEIEKSADLARKGQALAVPGTADGYVCLSILGAATAQGPNPDELRDVMEDLIEKAERLSDYNMIHGNRMTQAVANLRTKRLALGWQQLDALVHDVASVSNVPYAKFVLILRAEVAMTIAGILRPLPAAPDRPDRSVVNPARMTRADIFTALRIRVAGRRMARRDLRAARELFRRPEGAIYARLRICEAALMRKGAEKSAALAEAHRIAATHQLGHLMRRIDALLAA